MKTADFKTLPSGNHKFNTQYMFKAENGYGASIIQGKHTYGGDQGLWELAVLGSDGKVDYSTSIADDVIGYLSESEVNDILVRISKLKKP